MGEIGRQVPVADLLRVIEPIARAPNHPKAILIAPWLYQELRKLLPEKGRPKGDK